MRRWSKKKLIFCLLYWSAFAEFCDFAVSFLVLPDGPKNGTVKVLFFCSFTKLCMRSQKWDRLAVPFLEPCLSSFFKVFCIRVAEAQCFGFNETLRLMATGQATVEELEEVDSLAGFEEISRFFFEHEGFQRAHQHQKFGSRLVLLMHVCFGWYLSPYLRFWIVHFLDSEMLHLVDFLTWRSRI